MERLDTTNVILVILVAASVLQTLMLVVLAIGAARAYRAASQAIEEKVSPALLRLEGVLTNLEHTSAVVRTRTDDMSRALDTVQSTATHLGTVLAPRAMLVASVAGGLLSVLRRWRHARRDRRGESIVAA